MPIESLPFSVDELRRLVSDADAAVKDAVKAVPMARGDLGFPSAVVDMLAHLHGLLDLAVCSVEELEEYRKDNA